jgi:hypothetical protein
VRCCTILGEMKTHYESSAWRSEVRFATLIIVVMLAIAAGGVALARLTDSVGPLGLTAFGVLFAAGMSIRLLLVRRQTRNTNGDRAGR